MILSTRFTSIVERSWKNMSFHPKMAWPPATYDIISQNDSNLLSLNLSQKCARDERTATENVRCWCFILQEKTQKTLCPPPLYSIIFGGKTWELSSFYKEFSTNVVVVETVHQVSEVSSFCNQERGQPSSIKITLLTLLLKKVQLGFPIRKKTWVQSRIRNRYHPQF